MRGRRGWRAAIYAVAGAEGMDLWVWVVPASRRCDCGRLNDFPSREGGRESRAVAEGSRCLASSAGKLRRSSAGRLT